MIADIPLGVVRSAGFTAHARWGDRGLDAGIGEGVMLFEWKLLGGGGLFYILM